MRKGLKLEPYRQPKLQTYTVEVYCLRGERMAAPVKRIKGCWTNQETVEHLGYPVLTVWNKELKTQDPAGNLIFASIVLQQDGIWVYGMEQVGMTTKTYYQVWHLLPEPNEFTGEGVSHEKG